MKVATPSRGKLFPVTRDPQREPTHPGELLADVLESQDVSIMAAADSLDVSRQTIHRLIAKQIGVSADMAVRLGTFLGNGPGLWLRMQAAYDVWHAERDTATTRHVVPITRTRKGRAGGAARKKAALRIATKSAPRRSKATARA